MEKITEKKEEPVEVKKEIIEPKKENIETKREVIEPKVQRELKHSGLGIASFIISLIIGCKLFILIIMATILEILSPGGLSETSIIAIVLGLMMVFSMLICTIGLGLGIAGVIQRDRKKIFATLGLIFNSSLVLIFVVLMILGLMVK